MITFLLLILVFTTAYQIYLVRRQLRTPSAPTQPTLKGEFMFIAQATRPSDNYTLNFQATDSEGNAVEEADLTTEVTSSNPTVVAVSQTDAKSGVISFGSPGLASLNATVKKSDGTLIGSFGCQFTVTAGEVAAISGGAIVFDSLTEAPVTETPVTEAPISE